MDLFAYAELTMTICLYFQTHLRKKSKESVGCALMKQSDIDVPKTHFTGGYLPDPKKGEDNTSV